MVNNNGLFRKSDAKVLLFVNVCKNGNVSYMRMSRFPGGRRIRYSLPRWPEMI